MALVSHTLVHKNRPVNIAFSHRVELDCSDDSTILKVKLVHGIILEVLESRFKTIEKK